MVSVALQQKNKIKNQISRFKVSFAECVYVLWVLLEQFLLLMWGSGRIEMFVKADFLHLGSDPAPGLVGERKREKTCWPAVVLIFLAPEGRKVLGSIKQALKLSVWIINSKEFFSFFLS